MLKLIKNAEVYSPEYLGKKDILISANKILNIADHIDASSSIAPIEIIDLDGKIVTPGFLDQHVHILGGGGEAGFHSRTPEVNLSSIVEAGITTVVGLLGTDGSTRSIEALVAKANALENEGITAYALTGSYELPTVTLTGSVRKDIVYIDKVLGVKIALADTRSSYPSEKDLIRLVSDVRVAGLMSGKVGVAHIHMGDLEEKLDKIMNIVKTTELPIKHFRPTHVTKNRDLFESAIEFTKLGSVIDITAYGQDGMNSKKIKPNDAIVECMKRNVPLELITLSSDGNGSMPRFNESGEVESIGIGSLKTLHDAFVKLVQVNNIDIATALCFITSNVAANLNLYPNKGCIQVGSDADLLVMDENLSIETVIARGRIMMKNREVLVRGTFEV